MLEAIGLDAETESVYEAILTGHSATPEQLVAATGLAEAAVRQALLRLEGHGLVTRVAGRDALYVAVDPGVALDVLLLRRDEQLRRARAQIQELNAQFQRSGTEQDPAELVEIVTGPDAIAARLGQVQHSARHELRYLDWASSSAEHDRGRQARVDVLGRGGSVRAIYDRSTVLEVGVPERLYADLARGEQVRVLDDTPAQMILVDDRLAVTPFQSGPGPFNSLVIVHRSALLDALTGLFASLWRLAMPIDDAPADGAGLRLSVDESHILRLMFDGLPDTAISRQVGLAPRTHQRRVHDLMDRLHVQTRFQLAIRAALEGWLPAPDARSDD